MTGQSRGGAGVVLIGMAAGLLTFAGGCDGGGAFRCEPDATRDVDELSSHADVCALLFKVRDASYPALLGVVLDVEPFTSDEAFFRAQPHLTSLFNPLGDATYIIEVNDATLDAGLSRDAATAVLAHELAHVEQYVLHGFIGMSDALYGEVSLAHLVHNERQTDLRAIEAGYAPGLVEFRQWLYERLEGDALARKRRVYFTPEEIVALDALRRDDPERFMRFMADPPLSLDDLD